MQNPTYCPIKNSKCNVKFKPNVSPTCFIAIPFRKGMVKTRRTVVKILQKNRVSSYVANEDFTAGRHLLCKICEQITSADFGVVEATTSNPNVMFEFGIFLGRGKPVFILRNRTSSGVSRLPSDIVALDRIEYSTQRELSKKFERGLRSFLSRLDLKERQLQNLIELMASSTEKSDFGAVDSLLQVIYNQLVTESDEANRFVRVLEKSVVEKFRKQKNVLDYLRYRFASIRILLQQGEKERASKLFDDSLSDPCEIAEKALKQNNRLISGKHLQALAYLVSENPDSIEESLIYDMGFSLVDLRIVENAEIFFALLWFGLLHSDSPKRWVNELVDLITCPGWPGGVSGFLWSDLYRLPWHGPNEPNFVFAYWLGAVVHYYEKDENALQVARSAIHKIKEIFDGFSNQCVQDDEWYNDEYIASPRSLKKILKQL